MALNLMLPVDNTGVDVAYWRICAARKNFDNRTVEIVLGAYLSADARRAGNARVESMGASLTWEVPAEVDFDILDRAAMYDYIKAQPPFTDAQDA